jgi:hypothetical protein
MGVRIFGRGAFVSLCERKAPIAVAVVVLALLAGPVPGTATVIGHTVYTSSFKTRETTGLDARSGQRTFHLEQAGYTPMVSDGKRLYLIAYYALIGLEPTKR